MRIEINLITLSNENKYYLLKYLPSRRMQIKKEDSHYLYTEPYTPPPTPKQELPALAFAPPVEAKTWGSTFWSLLAKLRPHHQNTSVASIPSKLTPEPFYLMLSHSLLPIHDGSKSYFYLMEGNAFASGQFGRVFKSPGFLTLDHETKELTFNKNRNVIKLIERPDTNAFHEMVAREFQHLHHVDPTARLLKGETDRNASLFHIPRASYWLITKEIKGPTLAELKHISTGNKFKIALTLVLKLNNLHERDDLGQNHIHNDIKPTNIMIDKHNVGHFIDFGMASSLNEIVQGGTPLYTAPEFMDFNKPAKIANDIHALGIVLFQLFLETEDQFQSIPKGKFNSTKDHFGIKDPKRITNFKSVKVYKNSADKLLHSLPFFDSFSLKQDAHITGLPDDDAQYIFKLLKLMRHKDPSQRPALAHVYTELLLLANKIADFDRSYFIDTTIKSLGNTFSRRSA